MYSWVNDKGCGCKSKKTRPPDDGRVCFFYGPQTEIGKGDLVMLEHLNPEEIINMPLHLQILYYFDKWGKLPRDEETLKKSG